MELYVICHNLGQSMFDITIMFRTDFKTILQKSLDRAIYSYILIGEVRLSGVGIFNQVVLYRHIFSTVMILSL